MLANRNIGGVKIPCVTFYIVAVILIFAYGAYHRKTKTRDVLETKIIDHPSCPGFDGWAVTHMLFWALLGFIYPGRYFQCLVVSMLWESFEHAMGTTKLALSGKRLQVVGATDEYGNPIEDKDAFWYGRFVSDPFFNLMGYILGSELGMRAWPEKGSMQEK